jgi:hypothetical protein
MWGMVSKLKVICTDKTLRIITDLKHVSLRRLSQNGAHIFPELLSDVLLALKLFCTHITYMLSEEKLYILCF